MNKLRCVLLVVCIAFSCCSISLGSGTVKSFKWFVQDGSEVQSPVVPVSPTKIEKVAGFVSDFDEGSKVTNTSGVKVVLKAAADDDDIGSSNCRCVSRHYCQNGIQVTKQRAINLPLCHDREIMCCETISPGCGIVEKFPPFRPLPSFGEASYGEFPWTVLVIDGREDMIYGTGILVGPNLVLTTARNIQHVSQGRPMRVRLGEWDLASNIEPFEAQEFLVREIIPHRDFNPKTFQNDIAILRLNASIDFPAFPSIRSACTGRSGEDLKFINAKCFTAGWGTKSDTRIVTGRNILKKVDLKVHDSAVCERAIRRGVDNPDYHWDEVSFMCAGGEQGKGLCRGDEGAALVCRDSAPGSRYTVVGMASWGTTCGQGGFPGVFTNIPTFQKWIQTFDRN